MKLTLNDVGNLQDTTTAQTTLNNNNETLETAFENTLSRDGTSPNQMESNLDMDSYQILNLPEPLTANSPLRLQDLEDFIGDGTVNAIPDGGTTGQALKKVSNTDYDADWGNVVSSVALSLPSDFTVSGSPVTTAGTLTATYANTITGTGGFVRQTSPALITPALGTPSSGVVTNLTGTASININGTVGATTPTTGAFTTLSSSGALAANGGLTVTGIDATTNNQDAPSKISLTNNSAGTAAAAIFEATNGTSSVQFGQRGLNQTNYGALQSNTSFIYGATDFTMMSDGGKIVFAPGSNTEKSRFSASGGLSIGTTTDAGVGALLANTHIRSRGATSGIGYATGAGGAVTQLTSRSTGVTLNTVSGAITLFSAAGSTTPTSFTVTNSAVAATDTVIVSQRTGTDLYHLLVTAVAAGSFRITAFTTGGVTVEAPVINFNVIKGVAS